MNNDLLDPGASWCPDCGMMRQLCECGENGYPEDDDDDDFDEEMYGLDNGYYLCMCSFCYCGNSVLGGGICNECAAGAHQG